MSEAAASAVAEESGGLLDNATPVADTPKDADPNQTTVSHLVEEEPAPQVANQRPEFIPEKFWDSEKHEPRLEAMAKSYAEMEKNFKNGKHKAPEGGKYDITPFADKVAADDPVLSTYTEWAGKHGISQSAFEELASKVVEMGQAQQSQAKVSMQAERAKLGEQADAIIESMVGWARGLVSGGAWTKEDFDEFKVAGGTANGMRMLMRLRESYEGRVPLKDTIPTDIGMSDDELHAMIGDPKYKTNEGGYRDKVERLFEKRYGNGSAT